MAATPAISRHARRRRAPRSADHVVPIPKFAISLPARLCELRVRGTRAFSSWLDAATFVIAGLDPAIHRFEWTLFFEMDARVKPAHDESIEMESALVPRIINPRYGTASEFRLTF
jgi:hypothetical protein